MDIGARDNPHHTGGVHLLQPRQSASYCPFEHEQKLAHCVLAKFKRTEVTVEPTMNIVLRLLHNIATYTTSPPTGHLLATYRPYRHIEGGRPHRPSLGFISLFCVRCREGLRGLALCTSTSTARALGSEIYNKIS